MKITRGKNGPKPKVVDLKDIQVPDLWHVAQLPELQGMSLGGKPLRELVLDCWHLTHDLLNTLREMESTCKKCGSTLNAEGFCTDETCPYSDHGQDEEINAQ